MAKVIRAYQAAPTPIREQIGLVARRYSNRPEVRNRAEEIRSKYKIKSWTQCICLAVFDIMETTRLLNGKMAHQLTAFDLRGNHIVLTELIKSTDRTILVKGDLFTPGRKKPIKVVLKHYADDDQDITKEISIYKKLRSAGCPVIWISTRFFLWNSPVLVMKEVRPVTKDVNEFHMGWCVLKQLRIMHSLGMCHNDLKPQNIMIDDPEGECPDPDEDITERPSSTEDPFKLIDFEGAATKKKKWGLEREIWTEKWRSQPKRKHGSYVVTSAYYDFLELLYTMKTIQCWRTGLKQIAIKNKEKKTIGYSFDPYRNFFEGKLKRFHDRILQMNPKKIVPQDYEDLLAILAN